MSSFIFVIMRLNTLCSLVFLISQCQGYHYFDPTPVNYCNVPFQTETCKAHVPLFVNTLNSEETVLPHDFHYFDFCSSAESSLAENLGQVVFGDRISHSPYVIKFLEPAECKLVCIKKYSGADPDSARKLNNLKKGISLNYQHNWFVDGLPVTWCYDWLDDTQFCSTGFPMGCYSEENKLCEINSLYIKPRTYNIYNHVDLVITYHSGKREDWGSISHENTGRIISVKVIPRSIDHRGLYELDCSRNKPMIVPDRDLKGNETFSIFYSYSVQFKENDMIKWSSRWDHILKSVYSADVQLFSIFRSFVSCLFLSGLMFIVFYWKINNSIKTDSDKESQEASKVHRWKLLYRDVFRPPSNGLLLSTLLGSGTQVFLMAFVTLISANLGFFHPANRGVLTTCAMLLYFCLGTSAGFISSHIYKIFGGDNWKINALLTSMLCPGFVFFLFIVMNFVHCVNGSAAAVPHSTIVTLLALWFGVLIPLTLVGAYLGSRIKPIESPVLTNSTPRKIPKQSFFTKAIPSIVIGGAIPFGCNFTQIFFIWNSIWSSDAYYSYGFFFLAFMIFMMICAEVSIFLCFIQLSAEDYHWWWRSFLTSGFTAFYLFVYCIHYFVTKLNIEDAASTFLYFGYTLIMVFLFFLLTGTIGFLACFWFVRKIYSSMDAELDSYYNDEWSPDVEFEPNDKSKHSMEVSKR